MCIPASHLSRLLSCSLQVRLHLVSGVTCNLGNRLFKDGCCLPDWQRCVQVWFASLGETNRIASDTFGLLFSGTLLCSYLPSLPPFYLSLLTFILLSLLYLCFPFYSFFYSSSSIHTFLYIRQTNNKHVFVCFECKGLNLS